LHEGAVFFIKDKKLLLVWQWANSVALYTISKDGKQGCNTDFIFQKQFSSMAFTFHVGSLIKRLRKQWGQECK